MQRVATFMVVKPGSEDHYVEEHRKIWPEILDGIRCFGIRNYSIFMQGRELYSYFEVDNLERTMALAAADPDNQHWQEHMADFFDTGPGIQDHTTVQCEEVFHTDGYTGTMETVQRIGTLMKLKAGMEETYQEKHRNIWPEILEGIARVKIRNYTIFQIGKVLFSYFQVEDLDKAIRALGNDPDNQRWQEHMADMFDVGPSIQVGTTVFMDEVFHIA